MKRDYAWKYIFRAIAAIGLLVVFLRLYRYTYYQQNISLGAVGPSWDHWFGTDRLGRDLFSRVAYACGISLSIGVLAALFAVSFGTCYGIIAAYCGGKIDLILMRIVDILYPIPLTLIAILLMVILGRHIGVLFFAISIVEWMTTARIIRSEVLKVKAMGYIQAAKGLGQNGSLIIIKHVLPNISGTIQVCFMMTLPGVILLESFLSFLGIGIQPPKSSLGVLIAEGAKFMATAPWQTLFPTLIFVGIIFTLTFYGDRISHNKA
ncbi:MAG: ABC transporter permease [Puniceicoccales bacterium]|nr:ABC transporter permease [Puniceicoccales bacterium]